jgi:hypothetical protein
MAPVIEAQHLGHQKGTDMMVMAPLACFCLMVVGVILYQIDARAAGGVLHPSSAVMAELMLWRWGLVCLIAGVFGWVLMVCAETMRPPLLPPWFDDYLREDGEEEPDGE